MITVVKEAAAWNSDSYACIAQVIDAWIQPPRFCTFAGNAALLLTGIILHSGLDFRVLEILHKRKLRNSLVSPTVLSEAHVSCNVYGSYPDKAKRYLRAGAKLRKAITSFVMAVSPLVCPSVRLKQLGFHRTDYNKV